MANATETLTPDEKDILCVAAMYYLNNYHPAEEAEEEEMKEYEKQMNALWSAKQKL